MPSQPFTRELRTADQITTDIGTLRSQARSLAGVLLDERVRVLLQGIQSRRHGRRSRMHDVVPGDDSWHNFLVRGQLLVSRRSLDGRPRLAAELAARGYLERRPAPGGRGAPLYQRLAVFENPAADPGDLPEFARDLRTRSVQASVHHISPSQGIVAKAVATPEHTTVRIPAPVAHPDGVDVALIDTGLPARQRGDGWLTGMVCAPVDVDPLYVEDDGSQVLGIAAGHGAFVAGIVQQLAPRARVTMYRPFDDVDGLAGELAVAAAMVQAVQDAFARPDNTAVVINTSLGTPTLDDEPLLAVETALDLIEDLCQQHGRPRDSVLVVAAAGNAGTSRPHFPAASSRVTAVSALTADGSPAAWASRGSWVNCSTVGEGIVSTYVPGTESPLLDPEPEVFGIDPWAIWSGTSFAAPQITGAIAAACGAGASTPREALHDLLEEGTPITDFGRAVDGLLEGTPIGPA